MAVVLLASGCAAAEARGVTDRYERAAGDVGVVADASGPSLDAGMSPPVDNDDGRSEDPGAPDDFAGAASCYDGVDNDETLDGAFEGEALVDCDDVASCGLTEYCCVGSTAVGCCDVAAPIAEVSFGGCGAIGDCGAVGASFGTNPPQIEGGHFIPNGEGQDSGVTLGRSVDPTRERLALVVTVDVPSVPCSDCVDAVAIGLGEAPGDEPRVRPDIALMVRSAHADVALMLGDEVVWSGEMGAGTRTFTLSLAPDGAVAVLEGTALLTTATWSPRPDRDVLLYGRTPNRDAVSTPLRVASASVSAGGCEVPSALRRDPAPLSVAGLSGRSPSAIDFEGAVWLAFELDGAIRFAQSADGVSGWTLSSERIEDAGRLRDPELVVEDGALALYVVQNETETASIHRAVLGASGWSTLTPLLLPAGAWVQPSVLHHGDDTWLAVTERGGGRIALLEPDGTAWRFAWERLLEPGPDYAHFDDDEVADPDLVVDGQGFIRMYYAGRRGTRWAIGMLLSGDGSAWREPAGDGVAVLGPTGVDHDALGVRAPSTRIADGEVEIVHGASDGGRWSIARAVGVTR